MDRPRKPRSEFAPGEIACDHCTARCCRYFALGIDRPTTIQDYDHMRWYLLHGQTAIFVDGDDWYLLVHAACRHIREDFRCGIYEDRPMICRSYSSEECEYEDDALYDKFFETPEQLWEYAEAVLPDEFPGYEPPRRVDEQVLPVLGSIPESGVVGSRGAGSGPLETAQMLVAREL